MRARLLATAACACVLPALVRAAALAVEPAALTTSATAGASARVSVESVDAVGRPAAGVTWLAETSFGSVSAVTETSPGTYVAELALPPGDMPRAVVLVLAPQERPELETLFRVLPVSVRTTLAARTEPRSEVSAQVGGRTFGPVQAKRDGTFTLEFVQPPGVDVADVRIRDQAGNTTTSRLEVPLRPHDPLVVALDRYRIATDGTMRVRVHAFAHDRVGRPLDGAVLAGRASLGEMSAFEPRGGGVHVATWTPPADGRDGLATLDVELVAGAVKAAESKQVRLVRGLPASLDLTADPLELAVSTGQVVQLGVVVKDAAGNGLPAQPVSLSTERGTLSELEDLGKGSYSASLTPPELVESGSIQVQALLPVGQPVAVPARMEVKANPKVVPTSWRAFSLVSARLTDAAGAPVPGEIVHFHLARGEGRVTPVAVTNQDGVALADFSADPTEEIVTVEALATSAPSLRASTTIEKKASGAFAMISRPALAAQGGQGAAVVVSGEDRRVLKDAVLLTLKPGRPASLVAAADPGTLPADGRATSRITALLHDAGGNAIPDATLAFSAARGSLGDVTGGSDGDYASEYTAPLGKGDGTDLVTVRESESGLSATVALELTAGPATRLALATDRDRLPADGVSRALLTATVADDSGAPIPGAVVELDVAGTDAGADSPVVTDGAGRATSVLAAGVQAGRALVTARVQDGTATASVAVELTPLGPVTLEARVQPDRIAADGVERATLEAELEDAQGEPMRDEWVDLTVSSGGARLSARQARTDGAGLARIFVTGTQAGPTTIRVASRRTPSLSRDVTLELVATAPGLGIDVLAPACAGGVTLTATGDGFTAFEWDWTGEGVADAAGSPVVAALPAGTSEVRLAARDASGAVALASRQVAVAPAPVATIVASAAQAPSGGAIDLDGTSSSSAGGAIVRWSWDLDSDGDEDASTPVVSWAMPTGSHVARLEVTDAGGCTSSATVTGAFGDLPDLAVALRHAAPSLPVPAGASFDVVVTVSNQAAVAAQGAELALELGAHLAFAAPLPPTLVVESPSRATLHLGTLAGGDSQSATLSLAVDPSFPGATATLAVTAASSTTNGDADLTDDRASLLLQAAHLVDLVLTDSATPCPVAAGARLEQRLAVRNASAWDAPGAFLEVAWDDRVLGAPTATPPPAQLANGRATFDLGLVPAGSTLPGGILLEWQVQDVLPDTDNPLTLDAELSFGGIDTNPANNALRTRCQAEALPDLWVELEASAPRLPLEPGDVVGFTLRHGNHGRTAATDVRLRATLDPSLLEATLVDNPDGGVLSGNVIEWVKGTIPADRSGAAAGTVSWRVRVLAAPPAGATSLVTQTDATLAETDSHPADNADSATLPLAPPAPHADLSATLLVQGSAAAGQVVPVSFTVRNVGTLDAAASAARVELAGADWAPVLASLPTFAVVSASGVDFDLGTLAPGAQRSVRFDVGLGGTQPSTDPILTTTVRASTASPDPVPGNDTASAVTAVDADAVLELVLTTSAASPRAGETFDVKVELRSTGAAAVPAGLLTLDWDRALLPTAPPSAPHGALPAGASVTLGPWPAAVAAVLPAPSTPIALRATVTAAGLAPVTEVVTIHGQAAPDLVVTTAGPAAAGAGDALDVEVTVSNAGSTSATRVRLDVAHEAAATRPPSPASYDLGTIAPGASVRTRVPLRILDALAAPSVATSVAFTAALVETDRNPLDNVAVHALSLSAAPDLAVTATLTCLPDPPGPGAQLQLRVTVANVGSTRARQAQLVIQRDPALVPDLQPPLPAGLVDEGGGRVRLPLGDVPAGGTRSVLLGLEAAAVFPQPVVTIAFEAVASESEGIDSDPSNDRALVSRGGGAIADLVTTLDVVASPADAPAGGDLAGTLRVTNRGNVAASSVLVAVDWSPGVPLVAALTSVGAGGVAAGAGRIEFAGLSLAPGATSPPLTFTMRLAGTLPAESNPLPFTATATSAEPEANPADNTAIRLITATARAQACVRITAVPLPRPPAAPGGQLEYQVEVSNAGTTGTGPLVLQLAYDSANLPQVLDAGGAAQVGPGLLEWPQFTDLPPGVAVQRFARFRILVPLATETFDVVATASASIAAMPAPGDCARAAVATTRVTADPDLEITKTARPPRPAPRGARVPYQIDVRNVGNTGASSGAVVVDRYAPEMEADPSLAPGAVVDAGARTITWTLGAVPSGAQVTLPYELMVRTDLPVGVHRVVNTAEVLPVGRDASVSNDTATAPFDLRLDADLVTTLRCTPSPAPPSPGSLVEHVVTVVNLGEHVAAGASLHVDLGAGLVLASGPAGAPGATAFDVPLGDLAPDASLDVAFTSRSLAALPDPLNVLAVSATASSATPEADPSSNAASCVLRVPAQVDLRTSLDAQCEDGDLPFGAGERVDVTVTVANGGTLRAAGVQVEAVFDPALATLLDPGDFADAGGGRLVALLGGALGPSDPPVVLRCAVRLAATLASTSTPFTLSARAWHSTADAFPGDDQVSRTWNVLALPDLVTTLTATAPSTPALPGEGVTYVLSVTNIGSAPATATTVLHAPFDSTLVAGVVACDRPFAATAAGLEFSPGTIPPGPPWTATYTLGLRSLMPEAEATLAAQACAALSEPDAAAGDNCASAPVAVRAAPDAWAALSVLPCCTHAAGAPFDVRVEYGSAGASPVSSATVELTWPDSLVRLVDGADGSLAGPGRLVFSGLPVLAVGDTGSRLVSFAARSPLPDAANLATLGVRIAHAATALDANPANDTATQDVTLTAQADLRVTLSRSTGAPTPGSAWTLQAAYVNVGTTTARSATLTVTDPDATLVDLVPASGTPGTRSLSLGDVPPAVPAARALPYTVNAVLPATVNVLTTSVTIACSTADPTPGDNQASWTDNVAARADLGVSLGVTPVSAPLGPGGDLQVVVGWDDHGQTAARGTRVVIEYDPSMADPVSVAPATCAPTAAGRIECDAGTVAVGAPVNAGATVTLRVRDVLPSPSNPMTISAEVGSPDGEINPADNRATDFRNVPAAPDLVAGLVLASAAPSPAFAGGTVTVTALARNDGTTRATGATLSASWDPSLVAFVEDAGGGTPGASSLQWGLGQVDARTGTDVTRTFRLRLASVLPSTANVLVLNATVAGVEADSGPADNQATLPVPVGAAPDLRLAVRATPDDASKVPGDTFSFQYEIENVGSAPAQDVIVRAPYDPTLVQWLSGGTNLGNEISFRRPGALAPGSGPVFRSSQFSVVDVPPPPVRRVLDDPARVEEENFGMTRDRNPADNVASDAVTVCYQDVSILATTPGAICLGSSVTLVAVTDPASGFSYAWSADGGLGTFLSTNQAAATYTPPRAAGSYTVRYVATDLATGCTAEASAVVVVTSSCTDCGCQSARVNLKYEGGSLTRVDQGGARIVQQGETVAFRVTIRETNNSRSAMLLAGSGNTTMDFGRGADRFVAQLAHDVYVECQSAVTVDFVAATVPATLVAGEYSVQFRWVTDDSISGPPCGSIEAKGDASNPDRVSVVPPAIRGLESGIEFTDWGP